MIVTDKFVFVHLPRSGGTFTSEVIKRFFPSAHEIGYHLSRELLPTEYSHLPVLGAVRNPWEFYVSWYHHVWPRDAGTPLVSWMTENGRLGFVETTKNALNFGSDNTRLDILISMLPENVDYAKRNIPNITKDAVQRFRGTGIGYYTFRFNQLFGYSEDIYVCRLEALGHDLVQFFERIGVATDELREYILFSDKKNTAEYRDVSSYYTPELAELVAIRDQYIIKKFGYSFEHFASSPLEIQNRLQSI
jgi:hypothetical protein